MAFGAGVLISAVAFELVHEAFETSAGDGGVAFGLLAGSLVFFGAEVVIDRLGERERDDSGARMPHMQGGARARNHPGQGPGRSSLA